MKDIEYQAWKKELMMEHNADSFELLKYWAEKWRTNMFLWFALFLLFIAFPFFFLLWPALSLGILVVVGGMIWFHFKLNRKVNSFIECLKNDPEFKKESASS